MSNIITLPKIKRECNEIEEVKDWYRHERGDANNSKLFQAQCNKQLGDLIIKEQDLVSKKIMTQIAVEKLALDKINSAKKLGKGKQKNVTIEEQSRILGLK